MNWNKVLFNQQFKVSELKSVGHLKATIIYVKAAVKVFASEHF